MSATLPPLVRALLDALAEHPDARAELRRVLAFEDAPRAPEARSAYTAATLAAELGVTTRAVRAAIARGDLTATKRAGRWIIARHAVEAWASPDAAPRARRRGPVRRSGRPMADALDALDDAA
ncbi:MAG: helix-turn-helix domain-containing protein [Solirubrobacteraceae bacterium MAG38_C4-C5]|nr:helix-turn-helix domain-containing protein [Candidatus Siliceabacter maunaloa]